MKLFGKPKQERKSYDKTAMRPVIKASICNGEQVAGFRDLRSGKFTEVMLIKDSGDLENFKSIYGIEETIEKIY